MLTRAEMPSWIDVTGAALTRLAVGAYYHGCRCRIVGLLLCKDEC